MYFIDRELFSNYGHFVFFKKKLNSYYFYVRNYFLFQFYKTVKTIVKIITNISLIKCELIDAKFNLFYAIFQYSQFCNIIFLWNACKYRTLKILN